MKCNLLFLTVLALLSAGSTVPDLNRPSVMAVLPMGESYAVRSYNFPTYYVALTGNEAYIKEEPTKKWKIIPGLCKVLGAWTFQSTDLPSAYLRHSNYLIFQDDYVDSDLYRNDACFIARRDKFFSGTVAFQSVNYPNYYIRHQDYRLKISILEDTDLFKQDASFYVE